MNADIDYADLRQRARRAVLRAAPAWMKAQVDDLVQAMMMRLMASLQGGAVPVSSAYLGTLARWVLVSELRRLHPGRELSLGDGGDQLVDCRSVDPGRALAHSEMRRQIGAAIGRLSADRRRAVALYLAGHGVNEAAASLGWGAKRTENLVHRGLRDLRKDLARAGIVP